MPEVSVIVPVYNVEKYIYRCIDSIISQTFCDFELILVDDGSPDKCGEICDRYAQQDPRVRVVHVENGGVSRARNVGLSHVNGRYVTFVDSDDYCDESYLETLIKNASKKNADLVQSGYIIVDELGKEPKQYYRRPYDVTISLEEECIDYLIHSVLHHGNGWEVWSCLFVNQIIQEHQIRFCETCENFAEDLGFMLEYLLYCRRVSSIEENHYFYVQRAESMMAVSRSQVRLNPLNEIAVQFGKRFFEVVRLRDNKQCYPLLYHLIMSNQYNKMRLKGTNRRKALNVNEMIGNIEWHDKWMRRLIKNRKKMVEIYGRKEAAERILTARLLANRSWRLFRIEKEIAFRIFVRG